MPMRTTFPGEGPRCTSTYTHPPLESSMDIHLQVGEEGEAGSSPTNRGGVGGGYTYSFGDFEDSAGEFPDWVACISSWTFASVNDTATWSAVVVCEAGV